MLTLSAWRKCQFLAPLFVFALSSFSETPSEYADLLESPARSYAMVLQSQGNYILEVGAARLFVAQARLVDAQTHHQEEMTRMLTLFVNELERELKYLRQRQGQIERDRIRIDEAVRQFRRLLLGMYDGHVERAKSYLVLRGAIQSEAALKATFDKVEALGADEFIAIVNHGLDARDFELEPFPGGTLGEFLTFMRKHSYKSVPGKVAHEKLMTYALKCLPDAELKLEELERRRQELRDGTLDLWRPPSADGLIRNFQPNTLSPLGLNGITSGIPGIGPVIPR